MEKVIKVPLPLKGTKKVPQKPFRRNGRILGKGLHKDLPSSRAVPVATE